MAGSDDTKGRPPMGMSADYYLSENTWGFTEPDGDWLRVQIHDSSLAILSTKPVFVGGGIAYLGYQPRDYFDDPKASAVIDEDVEARNLVEWARVHGSTPDDPSAVSHLLARIGEEPEQDFVEDTVVALLGVLDLPAPDDLAS